MIAAVVVNYGTPELTIRCVESLLRSAGARPRVFVVDNASGDDSVEKLRAAWAGAPTVTVHPQPTNGGYSAGANAGLELARRAGARFVFVLNSDTVVDPECVRRLVEEAERSDRVALVSPRIYFGDRRNVLWFGGGRFSPWTGRPVHVGLGRHAGAGWQVARDESFATGCAVLVRLEALRGEGLDESLFAYAEDLDLSLRLRERGLRLRFVPDAVVWHDDGGSLPRSGGEAFRFYLTTRNTLRVVARHARWYHWLTLVPMLAVDLVGRFCVVAALRGNGRAVAAVLRGTWHAILGRRSPIERPTETGARTAR